mmetsp:Transcript_38510/g.69030  ORF Transcript_38510/g.69030 Transcript_38510/m.69030 type:complete len:220 (-) Transcript_38510:34-693(-)
MARCASYVRVYVCPKAAQLPTSPSVAGHTSSFPSSFVWFGTTNRDSPRLGLPYRSLGDLQSIRKSARRAGAGRVEYDESGFLNWQAKRTSVADDRLNSALAIQLLQSKERQERGSEVAVIVDYEPIERPKAAPEPALQAAEAESLARAKSNEVQEQLRKRSEAELTAAATRAAIGNQLTRSGADLGSASPPHAEGEQHPDPTVSISSLPLTPHPDFAVF